MKPDRGKAVALASAALAIAVIAALGMVERERIIEVWYAWRLQVGDEAEKDRAAERPSAMGSPRASGHLYEKVRDHIETWKFSFNRAGNNSIEDLTRFLSEGTELEFAVDPAIAPAEIGVEISGRNVAAVEFVNQILGVTGCGCRLRPGAIVLCPRGESRDAFTSLPPRLE